MESIIRADLCKQLTLLHPCEVNEHQLITINKSTIVLNWLTNNTHLYSSQKGIPMWLQLNLLYKKYNLEINHDYDIHVETTGRVDILDYTKSILDHIKPEMFVILSSGLAKLIPLIAE